jgi:TPR repeat protein
MEMANGGSDNSDLEWMPIEGFGTQSNFDKAAYWYRLAADQGHAEAQFELSDLYSQGKGVPRDQTEAFKLTKAAATQGFTKAATALGWRYANGRGVEKDESQAFFWYTVAARRGDKTAQKQRIQLAGHMQADQLNKAETGAVAWKPVITASAKK